MNSLHIVKGKTSDSTPSVRVSDIRGDLSRTLPIVLLGTEDTVWWRRPTQHYKAAVSG